MNFHWEPLAAAGAWWHHQRSTLQNSHVLFFCRLNKFLQYLTEAGFRVSRTHFDPTGVRTDATLQQFKSILTKYSVPTCTATTEKSTWGETRGQYNQPSRQKGGNVNRKFIYRNNNDVVAFCTKLCFHYNNLFCSMDVTGAWLVKSHMTRRLLVKNVIAIIEVLWLRNQKYWMFRCCFS